VLSDQNDSDSIYNPIYMMNNLASTPFESIPNATNSLALTIEAFNSSSIVLRYEGGQQTISTGSNTIYGTWTICSDAVGNNTSTNYKSNTLLMSNTLTILPGR
jgi:hypothetical protein